MFRRSLRLPPIAGIDVRLDPSLLLFAVLVAWVFGTHFLERHGTTASLVMAAATTVLFLSSVLAHELAHGLEARYRGIHVHAITLFFFGGMTEMRDQSRSPRDEFAVSAVGPYASLVCGAAFGMVSFASPLLGQGPTAVAVGDVAGLLAWLNVALAVFNLIPGAPLDGGRVLRAGLWLVLGDRTRAVRGAGRAGQLLAAVLALLGAWAAVTVDGALLGGLVLVMIGAFMFQAARAELAQAEVDVLMTRATVGDLVDERVSVLDPSRPLDLVEPPAADLLLPVVDGGRLVGTLPAARIRELHPADRVARSAGDLMRPVGELPAVRVDAPLRELVDQLLDGADVVVVRDAHGPVALLREAETARGIERLRSDGRGRGRDTARPATEGVR